MSQGFSDSDCSVAPVIPAGNGTWSLTSNEAGKIYEISPLTTDPLQFNFVTGDWSWMVSAFVDTPWVTEGCIFLSSRVTRGLHSFGNKQIFFVETC